MFVTTVVSSQPVSSPCEWGKSLEAGALFLLIVVRVTYRNTKAGEHVEHVSTARLIIGVCYAN